MTTDRQTRPNRARAIAETAHKTDAGVRLDLSIYLSQDGHGNIYSRDLGGPSAKTGIPVSSDLDLIKHLAMVLRYVDRTGTGAVEA